MRLAVIILFNLAIRSPLKHADGELQLVCGAFFQHAAAGFKAEGDASVLVAFVIDAHFTGLHHGAFIHADFPQVTVGGEYASAFSLRLADQIQGFLV